MGLDTIVQNISAGGSSPFFFTCAIQSMVFGEIGRKNQEELMSTNLEFKERMAAIRDDYSRERLNEQLLYRRESYELGKQYQIQQTAAYNDSRQKLIEFQDFCKHYWPLNNDIYTILKEQSEVLSSRQLVPMNVLIANTEVTKYEKRHPIDSYREFCERVKDAMRGLQGVDVQSRPWKDGCKNIICESMNINYIMQGMPTLLIFPYQFGDSYGVEIATWSFNRGVRSLHQSKALKIENFDSKSSLERVIGSVVAIVGMTRDAYMLAEYHMPAVFPNMITDDMLACPEINVMLKKHYGQLAKYIENTASYKSLCTPKEFEMILSSLENINKLLK